MPKNMEVALGRGRVLRGMPEKWALRAVLVMVHKEKRGAGERPSNFLENTLIIMNRMLVELYGH